MEMIGSQFGKVYSLGQKVKIQVLRLDSGRAQSTLYLSKNLSSAPVTAGAEKDGLTGQEQKESEEEQRGSTVCKINCK